MKNYYILTLFPDMIMNGLNTSITGRAKANGLINFDAVNIRDFTKEKHGHVDDYPYGGGAGMVMQPQPIYDAYRYVEEKSGKPDRVVYVTPQGKVFNQEMAKEFATDDNIVFLCGHYEGVDERILDMIVTDYVSIGDYVLTGGELPAMVMIDSISRMVPGVLNNDVSAQDESFSDGLLEYPQYTRPVEFMGMKVPDVLMSGHHKNIDAWRKEQSLKRTMERRPELLDNKTYSDRAEMIAKLMNMMTEYFNGDPKRIQHFTKVYAYAKNIGVLENIDSDTAFILETAAIVHDIGIKKGEEKYGRFDGKIQEELGPYEAEKILKKCGYSKEVIRRVKYLVGHHHTYSGIDGIDYQILVEADFIVNMYEDNADIESVKSVLGKIFKTKAGTDMYRQIFGI